MIDSSLVSPILTDSSLDYPTLTMPLVTTMTHDKQSSLWATSGGQIGIKTESTSYRDIESHLWLGTQLTNGQFYQATISYNFTSDCDNVDFYHHEEMQVFYVSYLDVMPIRIEPIAVRAITPEIDRACKSLSSSSQVLRYNQNGYSDHSTDMLLRAEKISIQDNVLVIHSIDEEQRMTSFRVF